MIPKKNNIADLEHKRSLFFEVGFVLSLGLVLFMMELNFVAKDSSSIVEGGEVIPEQEMVPITRQEQQIQPPPPKLVVASDIINIVDDDVIIEEELEVFDSETDENQMVEFVDLMIPEQEEDEEEPIFVIVEQMPIFRPDICNTSKEGNRELMKYIAVAIRYPVIAAENGVEGKVYVTFVVSPIGAVTDVRIARGVNAALDKEAIRVIENLPNFAPGKQRGKAVRVQYSVPINFMLQ
ncbi:energy transducer TonB [Labilibacter marinus]|uniref:energy transducer TonB n=1 Tax=Labilibacter marinus TaxID=1477105 RepID=UPI000833F4C4|nr:energy transducer TonB [Labilibacter marinus]